MFLRIPRKSDIPIYEKIINVSDLNMRKVISAYNSLNNLKNYSPYKPLLSETAGTIDSPLCQSINVDYDLSIYKSICSVRETDISKMGQEILLVGNAAEVLEKGTVVQELETGEKIVNYGRTFLHFNQLDDLEIFSYTNFIDFVDTGRKSAVYVDQEGNIVYGNVFTNKKDGKNYIAFKAGENGELVNASFSDINADAIMRKDIILCEEVPLRWFVDGDTAMTIDTPLIATPFEDYSKSALRSLINSDEYQESIGIQPTKEKPLSKNPFTVGQLTLDQQLKKSLKIGIIPFLVGPPGIGKTEIVESQSKHVKTYIMSTWGPTSFTGKDYVIPADVRTSTDENGIQITHTERALTGRSKPEWLIDVEKELELAKEDGEDVILFLDEFDKLTPDLQVFVNGIISNKPTLGGWPIPEGVKIVLAGNTTVDSLASNKISSEVSSRLMTIKVKPNVEEWLKWAVKNNVDPIVIAYIKINPADLLTVEKGLDGRVDAVLSMNPRKWVKMVNKGIIESRVTGEPLMINNYMTEQQVNKFMDFISHYYESGIEDILNGNAPLYVTEDLGHNQFVITIASTIAKVEQVKNIIKNIPNKEYRTFFIKNWLEYHPKSKIEIYEILQEIQLDEEGVHHGHKI